MGCMAGVITLWVGLGGAADGSSTHFGLLPADPGAKFAWDRIRTFGSEQVDMVCGLGMVGGHMCECIAFGSNLDVFGLDLAV